MRKELAESGLETAAKLGASYADLRFVDGERRLVRVKDGKPDTISHTSESGYGVRVIMDNGWGFFGSFDVSKEGVKEAVETAVKLGKASSTTTKDEIKLMPAKIVEDSYASKVKKDPFKVPLDEVLELLLTADEAYREASPHVRTTTGSILARVEDKYLATSEGSRIEQKIVFCGGSGSGYVMDGGIVQRRTYEMNPRTMGYEYIESHDIPEMARKAGKEAEALLKAEPCPTEYRSNLLLDDPHMYLQIHETIGHASELDRVLNTEADFAGMSFLTTDKLGSFRYGSDEVNFVADPTIETALGTYGYDDEGVPANKVYLVKDGILNDYQSSRETAAQVGLEGSSAGMRAATPVDLPIIRMNNICLEAGDSWKADEIIEDTREGILMRTTKMWSVDQRRLNFQFGCEIGWKIKDGELTEVIRDPTYTGLSYEFWRNMDATAKDDWTLYGTTGCGKGRPGQGIYVGHGAATTRIKDVRMGITGRI